MARWVGVVVLLVGIATATIAGLVLPLETSGPLLGEDGPIEITTALLWFVLAIVIAIVGLTGNPSVLVFALLAAMAGARELDAHAVFTNEPVTNLRYWTRATAPLSEKIVVAAVLIALIAPIVVVLRRQGQKLVASFLAGDGAARSVAIVAVAAAALALVDGTGRYYTEFTGEHLSPAVGVLAVAIEEIGELMLPVIGFVGLGQHLERSRAIAGASPGLTGESLSDA